ncbi:MAG: S41 family peptidase [Candidatus Omnitrophica bacterium]|nr:S41 family peptidase [Candidatus Omnitrophota bacterium]MCM8816324.1 S41 family peptidase [Candidatus Omnitrophota bacterium]
MKRKLVIWTVGFVLLSFLLGFNLETSQARKNEEELYRELERFVNVINIVKREYVNPVDDKKLIYGALKGMLSSLDPYSAFLEPEATKELQIETSGEFEGVGMEITLKDGIITVVSPVQDSPAWNAGIKPGDKIIEIDGQSTKGMNTWEAAQKLRGKKGTSVTVSILREHATKILKITLVRDVIKVKSVKSSILPDDIGYIRITNFQERTSDDLEVVLKEFTNQKVKGLILDLRNNPGGLLNSAIDVSQLFLPPRKTIVSIQGRRPEDKKVYVSQKQAIWTKPIVILINNGSASASEILTGALRDNLSACKTIGTKTFGKGSVQNLIKLDEEGTSIKLTIAYYYTPSGTKIDGKGIEPDVVVETSEDKIEVGVIDKDPQLRKAIEEISTLVAANK